MSGQYHVTARTSGEAGRYVIEGQGKVLLSDSAMIRDTPSVAPGPIDLLVAALGSCAVASAEADAREHGIGLTSIAAAVEAVRDEQDETRFASIRVDISVKGVSSEEAPKLLQHLLSQCPIFNTLRRGGGDGTVTATITATA